MTVRVLAPQGAPAVPGPSRWPALAALLAGGVLGGVKLVTVLTTPDPFRLLALDSDDAYYYVLTALNAAQGLGSTFDTLQTTNGYQPLWFLLLTGAFGLTGVGRAGAVIVTVVLLVALWTAAVWLIARVGREFFGPVGTVAALLVLVPHARWWSGCENALVGVVLLATVLVVLRRRVLLADAAARDVAIVGALLAVLALTRIDAVMLVGILAVVGVVVWRRRTQLVALLVIPTVITLAVYAAVNAALVGSPLPVSGLAKQLGPLGRNFGVIVDFLLFGSLGPVPLFFGAMVLAAAGWAVVLLGRPAGLPEPVGERAVELRLLIGALTAAQVGQVLYYAIASTWDLQGWYFSFGLVALALSAGVIGGWFSSSSLLRIGASTLLVVFVAALAGHEATQVAARDPQRSALVRDIDAARWADAALPAGSVIAMGDLAGTFAAATAHPVVQLEGLVGSPAYLDALQAGAVPQYLAGLGVGYYARAVHPGETLGCTVTEPYFGLGPTTTFDVCGRPVLYRGGSVGGSQLVVWKLS